MHGRTRRRGTTLAATAAGALLVAGLAAPAAGARTAGLDRAGLAATLNAVHTAGMPGLYAQVRDGRAVWNGAAGVADVRTGRPARPSMEHRVGSVTKAFTSAALMQQVAKGRLDLDAPIGRYLPKLVPGARGRAVTVRMMLDHTSGIGDYVAAAFPSLAQASGADLDRNRFRTIAPTTLARMGLSAAPTGAPGAKWSYSNTNYVLAGLLLRRLTGVAPERYITANVIRRAGLRHTYFPRTPYIAGPHSRAYESLFGHLDPPEDFSVYDMSWASTAGALVSTMDDLDRFYRALLGGRIVDRAGLAQMQRTVETSPGSTLDYGLGIYSLKLPCGVFWGHDGSVFGQATQVLSAPDGRRQVSVGYNLTKYQKLDADGVPVMSPIDTALNDFLLKATCGDAATTRSARTTPSFPRTG